ncbi:hypothetical protein BCV69DRAFT_285464 [Microstroma glucosiphilum]|uniref:Uncharacterized protein n=1 Tax=Pseudomicrostroma glucosiphilum TaxID=1684307 RepID=A0A316TZT5_9BASI|nr:hypothetical protein BCV69DRAFT_285464 [Pseudomicrostroma glucosiphilum]PWN18164.1 hypothetical protein BCV69DRAFT_285464 [Pseudomicrostroma glucosiphilum]
MGGAASKATRSLPKTTSSAGSSSSSATGTASASLARAATGASRPAQASAGTSTSGPTPSADSRSQTSPLDVAGQLGQTGRDAGPLRNTGRGGDPRQVGPVVERNEPGREEKDDVIRRDAFDPDFISQLHTLGPVSVDRPPWSGPSASESRAASTREQPQNITGGPAGTSATGKTTRGQSQMLRILQARQEREDSLALEHERSMEASGSRTGSSASGASPSTRTLDAPTLSMLLDELKSARSPSDVQTLCHSYDFDAQTLAMLTRRFNSPSIGGKVESEEEERKWSEERDADRPPRMYAVWREGKIGLERAAAGKST